MNIDHQYVLVIVTAYYLLTKQNKIVEICWIPSHIGIPGNTKADKAAKDALKLVLHPTVRVFERTGSANLMAVAIP
jgi:ribonuclease HI